MSAPTATGHRAMNLAHLLRQQARRRGSAPALVQGDRRCSWAGLQGRVEALAAALAAHGVGKGDRVLVHSRNCPELVETMFACFHLGAVWVPTNWQLTPAEVAYFAEASSAVAFLCHAAAPAHATAARDWHGLRLRVAIGGGGEGIAYESLVGAHAGDRIPAADVLPDDACWFFFTSGTTGRPKAAVLAHGQMNFVINNHIADLMPGLGPTDCSLVLAPLTHGAGVHLLSQVARGVTSVLTTGERLEPAEAWALVERWRITNFFAVPTIIKRLVEDPAVDQHDHRSLRHVIYAGAPMYREDQKAALRKLGQVLVQYYGLGEVTGNITVLPPELHFLGEERPDLATSCGHERTGMQVSIQDDAGRELPPGEVGEVCVCGPAVFPGYHANPEANARVFRNGWFRTGDLGRMDAEGYLTLTGRLSDMYISGGSNVYPREIEELLMTHPAVAEAAVVGVPDARWGEVGWAAVVLRPGSTCTAEALTDFIGQGLARYKLPRRVVFLEALPKSGYGKVAKPPLRNLLLSIPAEPG